MADYVDRKYVLGLVESAETFGWSRKELYKVIQKIPAYSFREDVQGKWIEDSETGEIYCSECEETAVFTAGHHYSCGPFCSNCGARMKL